MDAQNGTWDARMSGVDASMMGQGQCRADAAQQFQVGSIRAVNTSNGHRSMQKIVRKHGHFSAECGDSPRMAMSIPPQTTV